jgi:amidohydrolase family protein
MTPGFLARLLALLTLTAAGPTALGQSSVVLAHVNIIDVVTGTTRRNMTLVVTGNRIASIDPASRTRVPPGADVVDASGKYLIPGLWDMHVHAFSFPESTVSLGRRATDVYFPQFLGVGVTGIRDMGGWVDTVMDVRRRVQSHDVLGPRIVAAGRLFGGKNPWAPSSPHAWVITNPDSARIAVDSMRRAGANFIKVHDLLKRDVYFAIAAAARDLKLPLVGHMRPSVSVAEAIDAGQIGIEHVPIELVVACAGGGTREANDFYDQWINGGWSAFIRGTAALWGQRDPVKCDAILKRMKRAGAHVTPTLVLRMQDSTFLAHVSVSNMTPANRGTCESTVKDWGSVPDSLRALYYRTTFDIVAALHRAGVGILAGTDGPGNCLVPGASLHEELENLVRAGLSPLEALRAATLEPARFMGLTDSLGTIKRGNVADLVLLEANPLHDIRNTRLVAGVIADGRWISKKEIRAMGGSQ